MDLSNALPSSVYLDKPLPGADAIVGVGLLCIDEQQNHTGILYREPAMEPRFLELQWHHKSQDGTPPQACAFSLLQLHPKRASMVAAFCRFVGQKCAKNRIPYGFQLPSECLNSQGEWNLDRVGKGLTCATFVLAVFQAQRLDIAQLDDWQPRASDLAWKRKVIEALRVRAPEQASYLEANELECVRYRPEEVAGAAASGKYPAGFQDAVDLGNRILDVLKSRALKASAIAEE